MASIEFSFVLNSPGTLTDQSVYRPIWDSFADVLATYPSGPSAADLGAAARATVMGRLSRCSRWGAWLLPGAVLPLHVFEPRYRQLVLDCLADDTGDAEFGVGADRAGLRGRRRRRARRRSATIARIVRVEAAAPAAASRCWRSAVGRATVLEWLPDDPYPIADVEPWPDRPPDDDESFTARLVALAVRVRDVRRLAHEAARAAAGPNAEAAPPDTDDSVRLVDDPVHASYHLATCAPVRPRRPLPGAAGAHRRARAST